MYERVIVADDSAAARMIIKRCLKIAGCQGGTFLEAEDGAEALELAMNNEVDLLVTDLNMPKLDGDTLLKHIKSHSRFKDLPVLVVTSSHNEVREAELLKNGAMAVISKPVTAIAVADKLRTENSEWGELG